MDLYDTLRNTKVEELSKLYLGDSEEGVKFSKLLHSITCEDKIIKILTKHYEESKPKIFGNHSDESDYWFKLEVDRFQEVFNEILKTFYYKALGLSREDFCDQLNDHYERFEINK